MASAQLVLDTDTLSAIMRRNSVVLAKARTYLAEHGQFTISIITRYEILRGLRAKDATRQAVIFDQFCSRNVVLPLTDEAIIEAADIYADLSGFVHMMCRSLGRNSLLHA
jgi:tRNA(fMet)-specific endonuclease VapC